MCFHGIARTRILYPVCTFDHIAPLLRISQWFPNIYQQEFKFLTELTRSFQTCSYSLRLSIRGYHGFGHNSLHLQCCLTLPVLICGVPLSATACSTFLHPVSPCSSFKTQMQHPFLQKDFSKIQCEVILSYAPSPHMQTSVCWNFIDSFVSLLL